MQLADIKSLDDYKSINEYMCKFTDTRNYVYAVK